MAAIDEPLFIYGRTGNVTGIVSQDDGVAHGVAIDEFAGLIARDVKRYGRFANAFGFTEPVGVKRCTAIIFGRIISNGNMGADDLGDTPAVAALILEDGVTISGKFVPTSFNIDRANQDNQRRCVIRGEFTSTYTEV